VVIGGPRGSGPFVREGLVYDSSASNPKIARAFFVAVKTVEMQLSNWVT
jgi:hypothetical protein